MGLDVSRAACAGRTALMFDCRKSARAKGVCYSCPILEGCLHEGLRAELHEPAGLRFGVIGGLTPVERWRMEAAYDFTAPCPPPAEPPLAGPWQRCKTCLRVMPAGTVGERMYCSAACKKFASKLRKAPVAKPLRVCARPGCSEWVYQPATGRPRQFCGRKCRRIMGGYDRGETKRAANRRARQRLATNKPAA